MADWEKIRDRHPDFARPFAAEMFTCFMLRNFSLRQAEHIARHRAPATAVALEPALKRYFGIGNSTGLGMAPYLINHPQLISRWVEMRELALARIVAAPAPPPRARLPQLLDRAIRHLRETHTEDEWQTGNNQRTLADMQALSGWLEGARLESWNPLLEWATRHCSLQGQELLNCILLELHPERVDDLDERLALPERLELRPDMPAAELRALIESAYRWALEIDFDADGAQATFWYRSQEKQEPRLGLCGIDAGRENRCRWASPSWRSNATGGWSVTWPRILTTGSRIFSSVIPRIAGSFAASRPWRRHATAKSAPTCWTATCCPCTCCAASCPSSV